ncbi:MAG TPA: Mov34/MPN/PAD-1 family protein [Solirubrobacteraceae bacterium]|jgi:proteasome lid subunit RPN8/RPN11
MREHTAKIPEITGLQGVSDDVVYPHVFGNADREVGGVLVGRSAPSGRLPMVTGAIAALHADEQRATLTFTHSAWEHVHRCLDEEYPPDTEIVGWYHSHPSFGIFLSEHDLFIHRQFFSSPSQIALVVDPHNRTEGVFSWRGDRIAPLFERPTPPGWVADVGNAPVGHPEAAAGPAAYGALPPAPARRRSYPVLPLIAATVAGAAMGLAFWGFVSDDDAPESPARQVQPQQQQQAPTEEQRQQRRQARRERRARERARQTPAAPQQTAPDEQSQAAPQEGTSTVELPPNNQDQLIDGDTP